MTLRYRKDIQGLRALAVLLVVVFHSNIDSFSGGYVGVDVFFVISGYLITGLLLKELKETHDIKFKTFYSKRIKRILPLSLVVTATTLLIFSLILSPIETKELSKTGLMASVFSSNLWFSYLATSYFGNEKHLNPLLHTWSLGVEEQFYFLYPFLVWISGFARQTKNGARNLFFLMLLFILTKSPMFIFSAPSAGLEPAIYGLAVRCIIHYAPRA